MTTTPTPADGTEASADTEAAGNFEEQFQIRSEGGTLDLAAVPQPGAIAALGDDGLIVSPTTSPFVGPRETVAKRNPQHPQAANPGRRSPVERPGAPRSANCTMAGRRTGSYHPTTEEAPWLPRNRKSTTRRRQASRSKTSASRRRPRRPTGDPVCEPGYLMLQFQWNALRRGDHVLVHDSGKADLGLIDGVVTLIDVNPSGHDVSVRLMAGTPTTRVVQPGRFAVHLDPVDGPDDCWRCSDNRR